MKKQAFNPYLPSWEYIPDGEPYVWGGIGMSLIPVAIYVFFCMVLFIGFKAFNMEALAVGGFLALLIGGVFCTSYSDFWESAIKGISSITSVSVVVILLLVGMFSALIKLCGLSGGFVWIANAVGMKGGIFVAFTFIASCIVSTATGSSIGVSKGNEALLKAVNEAIKSAKEDGSLDKFVADATELAAGQTYEGTLDENGAVPEADDSADAE